jgi:ferredoxin
MHVIVNYDRCESHALCMAAVPEVFEIDDDNKLQVIQEKPPAELRAKLEQAVQSCPTTAIRLED